ncbi:MAG: lipoprotein [Myxococcaceae bacterium]|nr:lipoprotein [Myxococcaceae bacterium]
MTIALVALAALGCGGDSAGTSPGTVSLSIWGEDYIADQIPPLTGSAAGFENGWSVRYTRFLVNVGDFTVAASDGTAGGALPAMRVYDLKTTAAPFAVGRIAGVPSRRMDRVSYRIAPATAASTAGNAAAADLALMQSNGYGLYVEGEGTRMGTTVRFRWGFAQNIHFESCTNADSSAGLAVPSGGNVDAQITVHGDHFFYDDLQSETARLRFDAVAAADAAPAGNADGVVTLEELARVDLTRLPSTQYGGGDMSRVRNLRQFVEAISATVGHFNGEGHCQERVQ